jgi:hypothetical protein
MVNFEKELKLERDKIVAGLEESYKRLIEFKKQKNSPLIISRNGKVVALDPNKVPSATVYRRGK